MKLQQRRQHWHINWSLAIKSLIIVGVLTGLAAVSYVYHSGKTADVFAGRARQARQEGEFGQESDWLRRYLLLRPGHTETIVRMGLAADEAVAGTPLEQRPAAIGNARRALSQALATIGKKSPEDAAQLRRRLIRRLLQHGGNWLAEAERQIVLLDAAHDDATAHEYLAVAIYGQMTGNLRGDTNTGAGDVIEQGSADYWQGLAKRSISEVLPRALALDRTTLT